MKRIPSLLLLACTFALSPVVVESQVSVIGELSQDRETRPGEKYEGTILVKNDSNEPQEAKVYQTDYLFYSNGTNNYGEPGSHRRSNASWVTMSPLFLTLPPQATLAINYTVTVPRDEPSKSLKGTYWSMIMIEGIPKGSPESSTSPRRTEVGITQTIRYGIQIASHIANTGIRKIEIRDPKIIAKENGGKTFQFDLENSGDIGLRPDVSLECFNEQGMSVGTFPGVRYRIYPGTSVRQNIDISRLPKGMYKVLVAVDAGSNEISAWEYPIKL